MINRNPLPFRELKLAFVYATFWVLLLWVTQHPLDEWAATVAVLYTAMLLSKEIVPWTAAYASKRLAGYGKRVLQKYGITVSEQSADTAGHRSVWPVRIAILAVLTFAFGVALIAGFFVMAQLELTPLAGYLRWTAWGILAFGTLGLTLTLGIPTLVFALADIRRKDLGTKIARAHAIAEGLAQTRAWRRGTP